MEKKVVVDDTEREAAMAAHPKGKPLDEHGSEVPSSIPLAPPIGYKSQPSMFEVVRDMVRAERQRIADLEAFDSPEEADDFDVEDDYDPSSPWEYNFDPPADLGELQRLRTALDGRERELRGSSDPAEKPAAGDPEKPASAGKAPGGDPGASEVKSQ